LNGAKNPFRVFGLIVGCTKKFDLWTRWDLKSWKTFPFSQIHYNIPAPQESLLLTLRTFLARKVFTHGLPHAKGAFCRAELLAHNFKEKI